MDPVDRQAATPKDCCPRGASNRALQRTVDAIVGRFVPSEALLACGCPPWEEDGHEVGPGCPTYEGPRDARMEGDPW